MAKSKQVFIEVIVDDKGTTKKLAVDANKLEKALVGQNKQTKDTDRALRGAANMSSNTTKNFSKMTQGITGGIVPAYAELAARVFAVTAAFRFLQEAADTRNLIQGQQQFGALMGTNYAGITKALQDATAGQLRFTEAAQATAIGTAAGLTKDQLTGLATAAKNVSFALGRDLTDSFNRLIRGVTKAEPELLDELGIILRLEPATKEYAAQIGKAAKDLSAFERSQAVANFVLDEAERKFEKIGRVMDKDAFAVAQFGKAFDDVLNTLKVSIATGLTPVLQFLSNNITALLSLFAVLALPLVRTVFPVFDDFGKKAAESAKSAKAFADSAQADFDRLAAKTAVLGKNTADLQKQASKMTKSAGLTADGAGPNTAKGFLAAGEGDTLSGRGRAAADKALRGAEKQLKNSEVVKTGILKGFNAQQVADLKTSYALRERIVKGHEKVVGRSVQGMDLRFDKFYAGIQLKGAKAFGAIAKFATRSAKVVNFAFKAIGFLGLALLFVDLGKMALEFLNPVSKGAKRAADEVANLTTKADELSTHLAKVNKIRADMGLLNLSDRIKQTGNAITEANIPSLIKQIESIDTKKGTEGFKEYKESLLETTDQLAKLDPRLQGLNDALKNNEDSTVDGKDAILEFANTAIQASQALQQLENAQKEVDTQINNLISSIAKKPFEGLELALREQYRLDVQAKVNFDQQDFDKQLQDAQDAVEKFSAGTQPVMGKVKTSRGLRTKQTGTEFGGDDQQTLDNAVATFNDLEDSRVKIQEADEKSKALLDLVLNAQGERLGIESEILKNKKEIANVDKISQSINAKIERLKVSELQQTNNVANATAKIVDAELALALVKEKGGKEGEASFDNAVLAVKNAKLERSVQEDILTNLYAQNTVKEAEFLIDRARLETIKAIQDSELEIERLKRKNAFETTPGPGTVGKSFMDVERTKRQNNINILKEIEMGTLKQIADVELARDRAEQRGDEITLQNLDFRLSKLREKAQLDAQNLLLAKEFVLASLEENRLELEKNQLLTEAISLNPVRQAFEERLIQMGVEKKDLSAQQLQDIYDQTEAIKEQEIIQEGLKNVVETIQGGMETGLMSIVNGTKSAKEAFADFAKSVLASIAQMIIKMMVFNALKSIGFPGFKTGGIAEAPGARYGGVMENYSTGGIARGRQAGYPVMLHGTEAVVPLPNKKEIPVEIRGGTGNVNNISISVSTDGTTQQRSEGDDSGGGRALARVVSMAVQDELQKQKRPGGILSPFGAA